MVGGNAIIVTSSRLQETLEVEPCVELERESDLELEPSLLISLLFGPILMCQCQNSTSLIGIE